MRPSFDNEGLEAPSTVVWNKAIAALCDVRFPDEFPDGIHYRPVPYAYNQPHPVNPAAEMGRAAGAVERLPDGAVVWLRTIWLNGFVTSLLPRLRARFTLVTGDSDQSVPTGVSEAAEMVLSSPLLERWHAQNFAGTTTEGRISPIPVGVDLHTLSHRSHWGEPQTTPKEQEKAIESIRASLPPVEERLRQVYVDFDRRPMPLWQRFRRLVRRRRLGRLPGARFGEPRTRIVQRVRGNPLVYVQPERLPRCELFRRRGEYAFVLSPHGHGLDCHRTWESLVLGHIVIAKHSPLDPLYEGLPVALVDDWDEITPENLERWVAEYGGGIREPERLTNRYWIDRIRSRPRA